MVLELKVDLDTGASVKLLLGENAIASEVVEQVVRMERSKASFNTDFTLDEEDISMLMEHRGGDGKLCEVLIGPEVPCGDLINGIVKIYGVKRCHERAVTADIAEFSSNLAMMAAAFSQSVSKIDHSLLLTGGGSVGGMNNNSNDPSVHNNSLPSATIAMAHTAAYNSRKSKHPTFNSVKQAFTDRYANFSREMFDLIENAGRSKDVQADSCRINALHSAKAALLSGDLSSVVAALQLPALNSNIITVPTSSSSVATTVVTTTTAAATVATPAPVGKVDPKKSKQQQQQNTSSSTELTVAETRRRETRKEQNAKRKEKRAQLKQKEVNSSTEQSCTPINTTNTTATVVRDILDGAKITSPVTEDNSKNDFIKKIKKEATNTISEDSSSDDSDDDSDDDISPPVKRALVQSKLVNGAVVKVADASFTKVSFIYTRFSLDFLLQYSHHN